MVEITFIVLLTVLNLFGGSLSRKFHSKVTIFVDEGQNLKLINHLGDTKPDSFDNIFWFYKKDTKATYTKIASYSNNYSKVDYNQQFEHKLRLNLEALEISDIRERDLGFYRCNMNYKKKGKASFYQTEYLMKAGPCLKLGRKTCGEKAMCVNYNETKYFCVCKEGFAINSTHCHVKSNVTTSTYFSSIHLSSKKIIQGGYTANLHPKKKTITRNTTLVISLMIVVAISSLILVVLTTSAHYAKEMNALLESRRSLESSVFGRLRRFFQTNLLFRPRGSEATKSDENDGVWTSLVPGRVM